MLEFKHPIRRRGATYDFLFLSQDFCKMKKDQQIVLRYSLKVFFLSGRTRTRIFVSIRTPQILAFSGTG